MKKKLYIWQQKICKNILSYYKIWIAGSIVLISGLVACMIFLQPDIGTQQAAQEVVELSKNIRRYYQNRPDFWGLSTAKVIESGIYPKTMLKDGKLIGFFGNEIYIGRGENAEMLMPGARGFDVVYKNLNNQQCIALATFDYADDFWLGIAGITLGNESEKQYLTWNDKENMLPIRKRTAKKLCREVNFLVWHYE